MEKTVPIGVFAYNRPKHLELCLQAIKNSQTLLTNPLPIFIFCDFPKKKEHEKKASETQKIAKKAGNSEVIVREKNYGFHNITEGITQLCNAFGKAIIIEDDVIISKDFLPFMKQALDYYEKEEKVFMVSGFMYAGMPINPSTFFLPTAFIWGWGTWKRAWQHYSWNPSDWEDVLINPKKYSHFDFFGGMKFSNMLLKTMTGKWNTWDIQWAFILYKLKKLALYPSQSLVWNCGIGGGTHGTESHDDPYFCKKEAYIHGNLSLNDFKECRLSKNASFAFPASLDIPIKSIRHLACIFYRERWRHSKKVSLIFKWFIQKFLILFKS